MKLLRYLLGVGKRELNHLYTEPPAFRNGGRDEGWFCREHAFHTYFVARILGISCSIKRGHFAALLPQGGGLTSFDTDGDHAWCSVGACVPVDLSIGFLYYPDYPQLQSAIYGIGKNGSFEVEYTTNAEAFRSLLTRTVESPRLRYLELPFSQPDDKTLLEAPETFFYASNESGWLSLYGPDVFSKITLHIYKLVRGDVVPLCGKLDPPTSFRYIRTRYSAARAKIHALLDKSSGASG